METIHAAMAPRTKPNQSALLVPDTNAQLQTLNRFLASQAMDPEHHLAAKTLVNFTADNNNSTISNENSSPSSQSPSPQTSPVKKRKRVYKKRKSTNTIRREQKLALQQEIEELQTKLDGIKLQVLTHQGRDVFKNQVVESAVLRESIQEQHLAMAQVRALLSGHTLHGMNGLRPMETRISLSRDREERHRTLLSLRDAKVREARRFICARSHGLKVSSPYFQEERFETADGDFCLCRFEITPLCGVKGGPRAVYDAVLQASYNAEIIISETSGNITIRENDEMNDDSVDQMRLVSQTASGVLLETNIAHFTEFVEGDGDLGNYATIASDFVDEDELYPYRPEERVRRDVTAAMMVTSYKKDCDRGKAGIPAENAKGDDDRVVVVSRLFCTRVCHSDLELSEQAQMNLRDTSVRYASGFLTNLRAMLGLPSNCS